MHARNPYNYDKNLDSEVTWQMNTLPSMTQQQFKQETDINVIVKRFGITGELPQNIRAPAIEDFVDVVDYHSAMNAIKAAEHSFAAMPAAVRERFAHNPQRFWSSALTSAIVRKLTSWDSLMVPTFLPSLRLPQPVNT